MRRRLTLVTLIAALAGCQMMSGDAKQTKSSAAAEHRTLTPDKLQWQAAPPSLPPGAQVAMLEGNPARPGYFCMRIRFPQNYSIPPHWHPNHERVTVISGTLFLGQGETFDEPSAQALTPGSYSTMPPRMRHYGYTRQPAEIQLTTIGPWAINYLNPADDPRNKK
jgi:hypothetical protein